MMRSLERAWHRLFPGWRLPTLHRDVRRVEDRVKDLELRMRRVQEALGRIEHRQCQSEGPLDLASSEFRAFSQWGEDGILAALIDRIPIESETFVEIGVESYEEANTRFLLTERNWQGLLIERSSEEVAQIHASRVSWLYDLAVAEATVTRENVNTLLEEHGMRGRIGVLSIDVDGMDWWIWDALNAIEPVIVVIEYNAHFGPELSLTVPYRSDFDRRRAHHSLIYFGASLTALHRLADRKGYDLVGCNRNGVNAFFVRRDVRPASVPARTPAESFRPGRFREMHDRLGRRVRLTRDEEHELFFSLPFVEVHPSAQPTTGAGENGEAHAAPPVGEEANLHDDDA